MPNNAISALRPNVAISQQALALDHALTTTEAARFLGLSPKTLHNWRVMGIGPAFQKGPGIRGSIRYPISVLQEWRNRHLQTSTSQTSVQARSEGFDAKDVQF